MSILQEICNSKRQHVDRRKSEKSLTQIKEEISEIPKPRGFRTRLEELASLKTPAIIAEIKKASPSAGVIRPDFNVRQIAKAYEEGGAACLSILTDTPYFHGDDSFIAVAKDACALPVLRKDFMVDNYQIYESRVLGADCVLLIMAALEDELAGQMMETARQLDMDVLVEVHDEEEIERAKHLSPQIIGVNSRNLKTQRTEFDNFQRLSQKLPDYAVRVAESGIKSPQNIKTLQSLGFSSFLIGEYFMRAKNIKTAFSDFLPLPEEQKRTNIEQR